MKGAWLVLMALIVLAPVAVSAQQGAAAPIENLLSPPQLFASEGLPRAQYAPLPAFDQVQGRVIGQVAATLSPCPPRDGEPACGVPVAWHIALADGRRIALPTNEVSYEQAALLSYHPALLKDGGAWSRVDFDGGHFWVRTAPDDVRNYEMLATEVHAFDRWCRQPGDCAPVSGAMAQEIKRMLAGEFALQSCGTLTYQIDGLVSHGGKRYYKVTLAEVAPNTRRPMLPATGYIPTRHQDGTHTGVFWPRGC